MNMVAIEGNECILSVFCRSRSDEFSFFNIQCDCCWVEVFLAFVEEFSQTADGWTDQDDVVSIGNDTGEAIVKCGPCICGVGYDFQ